VDRDTLRILPREAVRETVAEVLKMVLELDRTAFLREHGGRKNGYYPRRLETTFGRVDLRVPRDREGRYYPTFLRPYTRLLSLLLGHRYSHETLSALTDEVLEAAGHARRAS